MAESKPSILIVDDVYSNVVLLRTILKKRDYELHEALSGEEALKLAKEVRPTLILLDIMMPEMDGYEVCRQIKSDPTTHDCAVIYISAKNTTEDKVKGLELGAVDFITKPFNKGEVLARVDTHISLQTTRQLLQESEIKYSTLVKNIQDGILLWNPTDEIIFCNPAFCDIIGKDENEILGMRLVELFYPDDYPEAEKLFKKIIREKTETHTSEHQYRMVKAEEHIIHTACLPGYVSFADTGSALITVRDITDRVNLERQLHQTQKMEALGSLTSGIAHDFNNILALINGYTELAMFEVEEDSPLREKLKVILDAGKSAVSLTKGLLTFGRKKELEIQSIDLAEEISRVHNFIIRGLPKNIKFTLDFPEDKVCVMADAGMLQQVVMNLCINSRDAMPDGGSITISLSEYKVSELPVQAPEDAVAGTYACVTIADTGEGIPEEILEKIFDPFFTTKSGGKGSGLGLAMVDRIMRNHHGWIQVDSTLNEGTSFSLYLPRTQDEPDEEDVTTYVHKFHTELNKVLVVDDDDVQLAIIQYFLEKQGYVVKVCSNGPKALEILGAGAPDDYKMVILDQVMPKMTGAECCKIINKDYPHMKVLMVSGAGNVPLVGDTLLKKPFTVKNLLMAIDNLV